MDNNICRAAEGQGSAGEASAMPHAENTVAATAIDNGDWRTQLKAHTRQRIVNKIIHTLKRHLPFSGQEEQQNIEKIAVKYEEKVYTTATSQSHYLRTIALKMLTVEARFQNPRANSIAQNPSDTDTIATLICNLQLN